MKIYTLISVCLIGLAMVACKEKGPLERAGERTDEIINNVEKGKPVLHKAGPVEKTGEAIDDILTGK